MCHCVRTYRNRNPLLYISLRPQQCIVNCATKGNQSNSRSGTNPHLNDLHYTIRAVALRSTVGSSGNMCGCCGKISVGNNGCGSRHSGYGSGGYINRSKRRGHARSFHPRGWRGYLIKCCSGGALMEISAILLSLYLLEKNFHYIICR